MSSPCGSRHAARKTGGGARLFSDQINGTLKCLLKRSKSMGGRRERVLEAFLWLRRGTPEDQGNEIGQWKDCFDKFCLKRRCCFLA